jgi:hypothetical protein
MLEKEDITHDEQKKKHERRWRSCL